MFKPYLTQPDSCQTAPHRRFEQIPQDVGPAPLAPKVRLLPPRPSAIPSPAKPRVRCPKRLPDYTVRVPASVQAAALTRHNEQGDLQIVGLMWQVAQWAGLQALTTTPYQHLASFISGMNPSRPLSPRATARRIAQLRDIGLISYRRGAGLWLSRATVTFESLIRAAGGEHAYTSHLVKVRADTQARVARHRAAKGPRSGVGKCPTPDSIGQDDSEKARKTVGYCFQDRLITAPTPPSEPSQKTVTATYTIGQATDLRPQPSRTPPPLACHAGTPPPESPMSIQGPPQTPTPMPHQPSGQHPAAASATSSSASRQSSPTRKIHITSPHGPLHRQADEQHPPHLSGIAAVKAPVLIEDEDTIRDETPQERAGGELDASTGQPGAASPPPPPRAEAVGSMGGRNMIFLCGGRKAEPASSMASTRTIYESYVENLKAKLAHDAEARKLPQPMIEKDSVLKAVSSYGSYQAEAAKKALGVQAFEFVERYYGSWAKLCSLPEDDVRLASEDICQRFRVFKAKEKAVQGQAHEPTLETSDEVKVALWDALERDETEAQTATAMGELAWGAVISLFPWACWRLMMESDDPSIDTTFHNACQDVSLKIAQGRRERRAKEPQSSDSAANPEAPRFLERQQKYEAFLIAIKGHPYRIPIKEMLDYTLTQADIVSGVEFCLKKAGNGDISNANAFGMYLRAVMRRKSSQNTGEG